MLLLLLLWGKLKVQESKYKTQAVYVLLLLQVWVQKVCTKFGIALDFYKWSQLQQVPEGNEVRKWKNVACGFRELARRAPEAKSHQEKSKPGQVSVQSKIIGRSNAKLLTCLQVAFASALPSVRPCKKGARNVKSNKIQALSAWGQLKNSHMKIMGVFGVSPTHPPPPTPFP